jgi:hypothetical protein
MKELIFPVKEEIFQFRVALVGSEPLIWRKIQVYSDISFEDFHDIIQIVMGWTNSHLYEFRFKKYTITMPGTETSPMDKAIHIYADEVSLVEMLKKVGQKFVYLYDFGDNWEHEILFEKRLAINPHHTYPVCIEGALACPPENIGGIDLFYDTLKLTHEDRDDVDPKWADHLDEMYGDYDPFYFNLEEINDKLKTKAKIENDQDYVLEEMIADFLETQETPFHLRDCLDVLDIRKTGKNEKEIHELIASSGEVVVDKDLFYPRISFLKDFAIRVTPTELEIENGILIPGHRLIPFLPFDILSDEAEFIYNHTPLDQKDITLPVEELGEFFGLLDIDEIPVIDAGFHMDGSHRVSFLAYDCDQFYKQNHFEPGDSIILRMEDFYRGVFSVHYDPIASIKKHEEQIKAWDNLFIASLKRVLQESAEKSYLVKQLMYTYFYMSRSLTPKQVKIPGTDVSLLLRQTKGIICSDLEDNGKILHFGSHVVVNLVHQDS